MPDFRSDDCSLPRASWCALLVAGMLFACSQCFAQTPMTTYTYKKVGDMEIKADVYRGDDAKKQPGEKQPVVVWIHGGALIMGNREGIDRRIMDEFAGNGTILVSIDYRLAPETQLPLIIEDVEDAFRWIREQGPKLFHADPDRIAVVGGSAGGYLTLTAGFRVKPRPKAIVSLWGYGDLVGPWYSEPSPHPRHQRTKLSRDEAYQQVAGPPISDARDRKGDGGAFYQFCRQQGSWPTAVSGWDPKADERKFVPFMPVRNVTADYPPTMLIHGDKDTDVPYEQSALMAAELEKHKVPHRLIRLHNGEHGLTDADPEEVDEAYRAAIAFIRERLGRR